jgi:hypothetical protein
MIRCYRTLVGQDLIAEVTDEGPQGICYLITMQDPGDKNKMTVLMKPTFDMFAKDPMGVHKFNESLILFDYEVSAQMEAQYRETIMMTRAAKANIVMAGPSGGVSRGPHQPRR